jgi:hypothetical protein
MSICRAIYLALAAACLAACRVSSVDMATLKKSARPALTATSGPAGASRGC